MHEDLAGSGLYQLKGAIGSPYSMKMRAVLRYRRIPFVWQGGLVGFMAAQAMKAKVVPVLVTPEGVSIGQSAAINNYIASTQGFLGSSPTEAAQVVNWMESLTELNAVWSKLVPYGTEPTAEAYAAFFDDKTAADVTGVADRAAASKRAAHWFLGRLERLTSAHGPFAVGNKLSLADVALFRLLGDVVSRDETNKDVPAYRLEPYGSAERTAALLASYPKIAAIVENVRANKNLQAYLAARPKHA